MCPTYKNVTSLKQTLNGKVIEPGQTVCSTSYFDENDVKLLKVDDAPYFNPIIFSDVITEKGVFKIPERDNLGERVVKYAIHFFLEKGRVVIRYNSAKNDPPLNLYESAKWNVRCFDRTIDKIIIDSAENFVLNVIIEKI
jgi:hypothetical protein